MLAASALVVPARAACALYSASGAGAGSSRAAVLPAPPAPTITGAGVQVVACVVNVSWPAPPAGETYTVQRTNGSTTTTIAGPTTAAGSTVDSILLSLLTGNPTYWILAKWPSSLWTVLSPASDGRRLTGRCDRSCAVAAAHGRVHRTQSPITACGKDEPC